MGLNGAQDFISAFEQNRKVFLFVKNGFNFSSNKLLLLWLTSTQSHKNNFRITKPQYASSRYGMLFEEQVHFGLSRLRN